MRVLAWTGTILCVFFVRLSALHAGEPDDLAPLVEAIRQGDKEARVDALWELGQMEARAKPAIAVILPLLRDKDEEIRSAAMDAVKQIGSGPESVSALMEALADEGIGSDAAEALASVGPSAVPALAKALKKRDGQARANAIDALTQLGPKAKEAVPALIDALADDDVYYAAVEALWKIKELPEEDVPALVALLRPGDKKAVGHSEAAWQSAARQHAMYLLGWMGWKARDAIPALVEALGDRDPALRLAAAEALWIIERRPERVLPTLIAAVQPGGEKAVRRDKDEGRDTDRGWAMSLLGEIGPQARQTIPAVAQALGDPDPELRCRAPEALWRIEGRPERLVPTLIALVECREEDAPEGATWWDPSYIRCRAAALLGAIGPEARQAVPALIQAIKDQDSVLCVPAIDALAEMGLEGKQAIPAIVGHLGDQRAATVVPIPHGIQFVGETAWIALGKMGPDAAIPLIPALKHKDKNVRMRAALALHDLGPQAKPAVGALAAALKDPEEEVRRYASRALGGIGPEARAAIPAIVEVIDDPEWVVRMEAAPALARIDAKSPQAVAAVRKALGDPDISVQARAVEAIGALGADAKPFLPHAIRLLGSREQPATAYGGFPAPAQAAAEALARLGPAAQEAAPALVEVLQESLESPTRKSVIEALCRMAPAAKGVLPDLVRLCRNMPEAALAVLHIDPQNDKVLPHLTAALEKSEGGFVSDEVVRALAILGPRAKPALPLLANRLKNDSRHRKLVAWAVFQIDPEDASAMEAFLEAVKTEEGNWLLSGLPEDEWQLGLARLGPRVPRLVDAFAASLRKGGSEAQSGAEALGRIGPLAQSAAPAIVEHLDNRWDGYRRPLVKALTRIGPAGLPHVVQALKDERTWVGVGATEVLGEIGKGAAPAMPSLTEALRHPRVRVRAAAATALGKLGRTAASAIPALKEACRDQYETVRQQAEDAIRKIAPDG